MSFSILFARADDYLPEETQEEPACFRDLYLDQIVNAIIADKQEYNLKPFFYISLHDSDSIRYRHEIMQDLTGKNFLEQIKLFAKKMQITRHYLSIVDKLYYQYHKKGWFLEAVTVYCEAVTALIQALTLADVKSRGLLALREYVLDYVQSEEYRVLLADTEKQKAELSAVKYCLLIKDSSVKVSKYEGEIDYTTEVEKTFAKFKTEMVQDCRSNKLIDGLGMNHIEAQILDCVAKLYPDIFLNLDVFYKKHGAFMNKLIVIFDREIQFYISYLEYIDRCKQAGLNFCYPQISDDQKEIYSYDGFDLALAHQLVNQNAAVVCNDFYLKGKERIIVVSGPNQGGKTTFARTFGQLHYLAGIGLPVPGREAKLFLCDKIFTHFEKEEDIKNFHGKLQDDLVRMHDILEQSTANSIIIMNEIFTSTTLTDAVSLGKKIMEKIIELDLLCVCVTFLDELASFSEKTVSMVSTVVPDNPAMRTYKIVRGPADGFAHALAIAEKYRLTYKAIKERIKS